MVFSVNLVGECTIGLMRDENIQKRMRVFMLDFHSKLNVGREDLKVEKERV